MQDTPGCQAYAWGASLRDFVEQTDCAAEEAPDEDSATGANASGSKEGVAAAGAPPEDVEDEDQDSIPNLWISRAVKRL